MKRFDGRYRLDHAKTTERETRDGDAVRSSRSTFVAVILLAAVLACTEREVSGAREGSFRARLGIYLHHFVARPPG
jgi:hypothetical protein